jgi:hypothetical protein
MDELIEFNGGEVDPSALPRPLGRIFSRANSLAEFVFSAHRRAFKEGKTIDLKIVNSLSFNALACVEGNRFRVIITAGFLFGVYDTFFTLLANPQVLPGIGNSRIEESREPIALLAKRLNPSQSGQDLSTSLTERLFAFLPKDSKRAVFALHMAEAALNFVISHEIAHVSEGHLDYCFRHKGLRYFLELGPERATYSETEIRALELSADAAAGAMGGVLFMMWVEFLKGDAAESYLAKCPTDEAWHAWGFALDILFRVVDSFDAANPGRGSHPDVLTRLQMAYASTIEFSERNNNPLSLELREAFVFGHQSGLRSWKKCGWPAQDTKFDAGHVSPYLNTLAQLRKELRDYQPTSWSDTSKEGSNYAVKM